MSPKAKVWHRTQARGLRRSHRVSFAQLKFQLPLKTCFGNAIYLCLYSASTIVGRVGDSPIDLAAKIERELQEQIDISEGMLKTLKHTLESEVIELNEREQAWLDCFEKDEAPAEFRVNFEKAWKPLTLAEVAETTKCRQRYVARCARKAIDSTQTEEAREFNSAPTRATGQRQPGLTRASAPRSGVTGDRGDLCDSADDDDSDADGDKTRKRAACTSTVTDGGDYDVAKRISPAKRSKVLESEDDVSSDKDAPRTSTSARRLRETPEKRRKTNGQLHNVFFVLHLDESMLCKAGFGLLIFFRITVI